jgi:hypothetical protein
MEEGDHSECSIELLSCPEHRADQMRAMGYEPGYTKESLPQDSEESSMFKDNDGNPIVGFCLWCNQNFYSMEEVEAHNAENSKACPVFQELKDKNCGPPVLCQMLEDAGLLSDGEQKPKKRKRSSRKKSGAAKN